MVANDLVTLVYDRHYMASITDSIGTFVLEVFAYVLLQLYEPDRSRCQCTVMDVFLSVNETLQIAVS